MTDQTTPTGAHRVRRHLLQRCDDAGLKRPRSMTIEAWGKARDRIVAALDHMTAKNLETLAEILIDNAGARSEWPGEATVRHIAKSLQPRPVTETRIVTSWLASVEGPMAEAGGYLVELLRYLRRTGRPPAAFEVERMRSDGRDNRAQLARLAARIESGLASPDEAAWSEAYLRDQAEARAIVAGGQSGRDAKAGSAA